MKKDWLVCPQRFGKGTSGTVYRACQLKDSVECCSQKPKFIAKVQANDENANNELRALLDGHACSVVVKLYDHWIADNQTLVTIIDFLPYGVADFIKHMQTNRISLSDAKSEVRRIYCETITKAASEAGVVSLDVPGLETMDNDVVNLRFTEEWNPMLFDFGRNTVFRKEIGPEQFQQFVNATLAAACGYSPQHSGDDDPVSAVCREVSQMTVKQKKRGEQHILTGTIGNDSVDVRIQKVAPTLTQIPTDSSDRMVYYMTANLAIDIFYENDGPIGPPDAQQQQMVAALMCSALYSYPGSMTVLMKQVSSRAIDIPYLQRIGFSCAYAQKEHMVELASKGELFMESTVAKLLASSSA